MTIHIHHPFRLWLKLCWQQNGKPKLFVLYKLSALLTKQQDVLVHFKFLPGDFFFSFSFAMDVQLPSFLGLEVPKQ